MDSRECLKLLREIKDAAFATVDRWGRPQVRIIDVMLVEDETLYFVTARGKDFYRQLTAGGPAGGAVAVTALTRDFEMIRLSGTAERLGDQKRWVDKIFEANPVMNHVYPGDSRYILEPFCIAGPEIEYFNLGCSPIRRETYAAADPSCGGPITEKGFSIGSSCVGCGRCAEVCPQKCVEEGTPYRIRQNNCLHCGLCFESCPAGAVTRKAGPSC